MVGDYNWVFWSRTLVCAGNERLCRSYVRQRKRNHGTWSYRPYVPGVGVRWTAVAIIPEPVWMSDCLIRRLGAERLKRRLLVILKICWFLLLFSGNSVIVGFPIENDQTELQRGGADILWVLVENRRRDEN